MKDKCNTIPIDSSIDITKMHGHMTITLTDVNTGEVETHEDDNMMTNALQEYFRNLGLLNYPNVSQSNMVELLLGGVMGFDDVISEDASIVRVPAGHRMIFNGRVGTTNNGNPTEMGSYSSTESGWQEDGSYVQTYDFSTSQANGTIACVCLTSKAYGFYGEGNTTSKTRHASTVNIFDMLGTTTHYSWVGHLFKVDFTNSVCYTFTTERVEEEQGGETVTVTKGVVIKYQMPASKLNIKGTPSNPIILSKTYSSIDDDFINASKMFQNFNGDLYAWNIQPSSSGAEWGNGWTQYLWKVSSNGTITKQTISNTYNGEETLYGLQAGYVDGNYIFFVSVGGGYADSTKVYILNRTTGVISKIENAGGGRVSSSGWASNMASFGWDIVHSSGDGRIVTSGDYPFMCDAVLMEGYPTNKNSSLCYHFATEPNKLIWVDGRTGSNIFNLIRSQTYIASINNLETPVVKTSEKTMKIVYRITFEEEEEE